MDWSDFWFWFFDALLMLLTTIGIIVFAFILYVICMMAIVFLITHPIWLAIIVVCGAVIGCIIYAIDMSK